MLITLHFSLGFRLTLIKYIHLSGMVMQMFGRSSLIYLIISL